jgi:membrane protease YdiL (CAAX protease family)
MIQGMFIGVPPALWTAVILWRLFYRKKAAFSELYLTRTNRIGSDIVIGLCLGALWVAIYVLFDVVSWQKMFTCDHTKLVSIPASVSAGFCEEFLYRGFLFWIVASAGGRKASILIVSSIAFGLAHFFWGPWGMLWTTVLGFTFGLAVLWRGSVWSAVIAHTLLNLCIEPGLIEKALTGEFSK